MKVVDEAIAEGDILNRARSAHSGYLASDGDGTCPACRVVNAQTDRATTRTSDHGSTP